MGHMELGGGVYTRIRRVVACTITAVLVLAFIFCKLSDGSFTPFSFFRDKSGTEDESDNSDEHSEEPYVPTSDEIASIDSDLSEEEKEEADKMADSTFNGQTFSKVVADTGNIYDNNTPLAVLEELEKTDFTAGELGIEFNLNSNETSIAANTKLYDMCMKYFQVSLDGHEIPPLLPMAIANNETAGRADSSITYSSLFPSAVLKINSVEDIEKFDCRVLLADPKIFKALATEWSTRDRGALQMNPNYGCGASATIDAMMGVSEAEKLKNVDVSKYSGYTAAETKNGTTVNLTRWINGASTRRGDRFNVKDCILRMAGACISACKGITQCGYKVRTDPQLIVMMAQYHGASGVWSPSVKEKAIGNWKSGRSAYEYSLEVGSTKMYHLIKQKAANDLSRARNRGSKVKLSITDQEAMFIWAEARAQGLVSDYSAYVREKNLYWITYLYPVRILYNYALLELLYSGF